MMELHPCPQELARFQVRDESEASSIARRQLLFCGVGNAAIMAEFEALASTILQFEHSQISCACRTYASR